MFPRIIGALVSLLCATPFYALALGRSDPHTPIPFWSGDDDRLRDKLSDIPAYNREMAALYTRFAGQRAHRRRLAGRELHPADRHSGCRAVSHPPAL